ncbi:LysR substrate-binding domain-containing protein [Burkholderia oklahomensis]|uniref:LysR family transcriptional regulator n=1 Tax=Burkholderia oklahomensis TaxID=342113 RepID=UPI00264DC067|nr:LysR substrate-binding domain-containing protein [Burkholderia oklahomensis]MDN7671082.1 LysR substrate-binding domain-containing protein [Burkholderia oklahomensis]
MLAVEQYFSRQLKLRHLHLLVALVDLRTVGEVAATMHVTQPAVSKMITEMEKGVGIALFERDGRRIKPTPYGECLIRHARTLLAHAERASAELQAMSNGAGGRVEVGVLSVAAPMLIPRAVTLFKQYLPSATVSLHEGTLDVLTPELRAGRLDLIVGRIPLAPLDPDLLHQPLFDDPVVIVAARGHALAQRRRMKWKDLEGHAWIVPTLSAPMNQRLLSVLATHGVRTPDNMIESVVIASNVALLQLGTTLGLLPQSLAQHYEAAGVLRILPLTLGGVMGSVGMTWMRANEETPAASLMKACLDEAAKGIQS